MQGSEKMRAQRKDKSWKEMRWMGMQELEKVTKDRGHRMMDCRRKTNREHERQNQGHKQQNPGHKQQNQGHKQQNQVRRRKVEEYTWRMRTYAKTLQ